jgi:hypothetical protein
MPTFTDPTLATIHRDMLLRYRPRLTAYSGEPETFRDLLVFGLECCNIQVADIAAEVGMQRAAVSKWRKNQTSPAKPVRIAVCRFIARKITLQIIQI